MSDAAAPTKKPAKKTASAKAEKEKTPSADQVVDAALAEVDDEDTATGEFGGVKFTFSRKALDSVQWRRLMQRNRDLLAIEWLLTTATMNAILEALADDKGLTSSADFEGIWDAIGAAAGTGNSSGSST